MKTILLIEDNFEIRENTVELLELEGYHVIFAVNGKEGLDLAKEQLPNVILCDILMPEMNGYEVFHQLKTDPKTTAIPFIFLTASFEKKEIIAGLGVDTFVYLRKPFEVKELFQTIEKCLL